MTVSQLISELLRLESNGYGNAQVLDRDFFDIHAAEPVEVCKTECVQID